MRIFFYGILNIEHMIVDNNEQINRIDDNYKFLIELGKGSFGSVWHILDKKSKKD